jgi:two-component system sensor histidine kinase HydH
MWKTISSGKTWRGEVKNKAKDGTFYWVKTIIVPFLGKNGKPEEYVSIRTDVTTQKTLQDQLLKAEKLSIIGELSARLAHDLRNPLSVIKNTIELIKIKNPDLPEKVLEDLYKLNRAISRMTHQIDDVLDFVKSKPLRLERCSVFKTLYGSLERITKPSDVKINMPLNDTNIMADSEKLETVFANLITNAIQAMSNRGEINIRIMDQKDHLVIEVEDTGPGITSDVLPYIFEPLFTTKQTGTGLGLASCKSIVEKHGGKIDARTIVGKGTIFVITLPKHM